MSWDFGNDAFADDDTVSQYTYDEVGNYIIRLTTINEYGCQNTYNTEIEPTKRIPFYAPNAFTPDGDEINEVFKPVLNCARNYELWISNRWGAIVYYSNDINNGWDGTFEGQLAPVGVYTWKAKYDGAKVNQVKLGQVHLMH